MSVCVNWCVNASVNGLEYVRLMRLVMRVAGRANGNHGTPRACEAGPVSGASVPGVGIFSPTPAWIRDSLPEEECLLLCGNLSDRGSLYTL